MLEILAVAIALVGSAVAAAWDLKTTEIPDEIPYAMIAAGIAINSAASLIVMDYWPIVYSMVAGLCFLGFGFLMYYLGQWGGGDAKLLAAIGFLIPVKPSFIGIDFAFPFPFSYFTNVFLIGTVYMLAYAVMIAAMNRKIIKEFLKSLAANSRIMFVLSAVLFAVFLGIGAYMSMLFNAGLDIQTIVLNSLLPMGLAIGVFVLWRFVKVVDSVGFRRRMKVSDLKVGDVLLENRLVEGITEKELRRIRRSKRYVWVKEGVRFAPAFPIALLVTLIFGDTLLLLIKSFA